MAFASVSMNNHSFMVKLLQEMTLDLHSMTPPPTSGKNYLPVTAMNWAIHFCQGNTVLLMYFTTAKSVILYM
jgi:hypothetical protein